ncbi:TetR family transcriptional regulator C-terminal domain-containing protein [Crocinitomicaceae bacterium]|nr:TetR family transcriptional regulator C-terminal domain-containing protein [Crocinitomicaceae bacterium]
MKKEDVLSAYSEFLTKHNKRPLNMADFAESLEINEVEIYEFYADFGSMEADIMNHFVINAMDLTKKSNGQGENNKEMLLIFYYSLAEVLKANRSLVLFLLPMKQGALNGIKTLSAAKRTFLDFLEEHDFDTKALSFIPDGSMKTNVIKTGAWMQFCSILLYWLKDTSADFEKTDLFIEKSLKLSFDLVDSNVAESFIDFGKFMFSKS